MYYRSTLPLRFLACAALLAAFVTMLGFVSCSKKEEAKLVVYAYDSFVSEWGPGPHVFPAFEKASGIRVEVITPGDAGQVLGRAIDEKKSPQADVLIGIDNNLLPKALEHAVLAAYKPKNSGAIPPELVLDGSWRLTPYDFSTFAIMWDAEKLEHPPLSLLDLTKPEYAKKLILMDPRSSTPGLGFAAWTKAVFGAGLSDYWKALKPSILTISPGWDTGYGLFTSGEAPLVISYTTSAAYHEANDSKGRYRALEFSDGHPVQIEGVGIVEGSRHRKAAEAFVDFMLSSEVQSIIPTTNWMYPVISAVPLPECYSAAPKPAKLLPPAADIDGAVKIITNILSAR